MATHLVTGHAGTQHIKPSDDGAFNAGVLGTGKYVLNLGSKFQYEIISNNLVKINDGELVNQGRHINIPSNSYEEVTIENGLQSVKRNDIICMRYTKNEDTSIESASLVIVKGTSSASPSDPVCENGDILAGESVDDFPLYRVRLNGLNIEGVDCLFEVLPRNIEEMNGAIDEIETSVGTMQDSIDTLNSNLTTTIETITTSSGNAYLYRCGKIRVLSMIAAKNNEIILSEDDVPPSTIYGVCTYLDGNTWKYDALVNINSNGMILCTKIGIEHLNTKVTGNIMWIVD